MNNQEVFDKVARHLLTQGERAMDARDSCLYRTDGGLKCAIGCLIPDEVYSPDIEGKSIVGTVLDVPAMAELFSGVDRKLLEGLQYVHDDLQPRNWRTGLSVAAAQHALNADVLTEFA